MTARFKGFTLVELLIVIAIIGVLAVVVLVAINPVEQLAKTRDAGRISTVTQLGHAIQAYYTSHATGTNPFPLEASWSTDLTTSGELSVFPGGIAYSAYSVTACAENVQPAAVGTYCYDLDAVNGRAIAYARMESNNQNTKCTAPAVGYVIFSTADGRGGIVCGAAGGLDPLAAGGFTYI